MASCLFHDRVPVDVGEKAQTKPEIVDKSVEYVGCLILPNSKYVYILKGTTA
jgi:hypothetical protein